VVWLEEQAPEQYKKQKLETIKNVHEKIQLVVNEIIALVSNNQREAARLKRDILKQYESELVSTLYDLIKH
jgi:hypothetical protein